VTFRESNMEYESWYCQGSNATMRGYLNELQLYPSPHAELLFLHQ